MDPDHPDGMRLVLPERFHSEETGAPFTTCVECRLPLAECSSGYMVQKCSNGRETIFEFALCMSCGESLHASYSSESRTKIEVFFMSEVDIDARYEGTDSLTAVDFADHLLARCLTCGNPPERGEPATIAAICEGREMLVGQSPICLCSHCEETLNSLVSRQTRDEWNRFIERNFDLPPSDALTPDGAPVLVF